MASGSFSSSIWAGKGASYARYIEVVWSSTNDITNNQSTISWDAYARSPSEATNTYVYAKNVKITINGEETYVVGNTHQKLYKNTHLGNGAITVSHGVDGTLTIPVAITAQIYVYGTDNSTFSGSITMTPNPVYALAVSADTGSTITVNRTYCSGVGGVGDLSAGSKKLCQGDVLKITASANENYQLRTLTVNSSPFTSGNSYAVGGSVTVTSTAQVLASSVGATNADIGSTSTITVTKYNTSYYHSLQYSFGGVSGYINADGTTSSTEVKITQTSVAFTVPTTFYAQIPNSKTGICTITCRTYSDATSTTVLGNATTCAFTATTSASACAPIVSGTVVDINNSTKELTGNPNTLIRYKSTAKCTISVTGRNSVGSITSKYINDVVPTDNEITVSSVSTDRFIFNATDSRGYPSTSIVTPTMIAYINLTCNPIIYRPTPTGSDIVMTVSGDFYRGSFGAYSNTLTIRHRYRETGGSYGNWNTIDPANIIYGTSSYSSTSMIKLGDNFDYQKSYEFQIEASDGADGVALTTVTKIVAVQRGVPVFDWGEHDFNFHVPIKIGNTTLTEAQLQQLLALIT